MFFIQPTSSFGDLICEELDSEEADQRRWQSFEFAVAWVNQPGAEIVKESARTFLSAGGCIRATVGLDFSSTSYEGLGSFLDLEDGAADITTHVFFDENPACTFHPKVFLFGNAKEALLLVGSNNMTGAGLDTNVEATLVRVAASDDDTVLAARQALEEWRDTDSQPRRCRRLTREFLEELRERGYVRTEKEIRDRRRSEAQSKSSKGEPLFGRSRTSQGRRRHKKGDRRSDGGNTASTASGEALLMRVRPRRTGTQVQISMTVHQASFMKGAEEVISADGSGRRIGYDHVKRGEVEVPNIARFEAPEMRGMANPVARFRWVDPSDSGSESGKVLLYEIFDADHSTGANIFHRLEEGIANPPSTNLDQLSQEETVLSRSDRESAQWYRLDSD